MATKKVELLLNRTIENLGLVGDVVKVKPGFARNYLLPHAFAEAPTAEKIEALKLKGDAKRGEEELAGSGRTANIAKLLDPAQRHPTAHNVYLLPYIGSTYQGYAALGGRQVVAGVWTDKPSRGKQPPEKCLLVEPGEFKQGSFSRTVAHELGHILGLKHPAPNTPPFHLLMGGNHPGNDLTAEEKALALKTAADLSATVPPH